VPLFHPEVLKAASEKAKVPVKLIVVKNGGPIFHTVAAGPPAEPSQKEITTAVCKFFDEHLQR
jgi:hypothetical protein